MNAKKFFAVFVFIGLSFLIVRADAMPEQTPLLADLCTWQFDEESFSYEADVAGYVKSALDEGDDYAQTLRNEASIMRNRKSYTQEQALEEIRRMVDDGKLQYYIVGKGQYRYTSGINSVYTTTNVNLRSQPNTKANIITVVQSGGYADGYITPELSDYLGEWTSPEGDTWVLVKYRTFPLAKDSEKKLGWLSKKYVRFLTDNQVMKVAEIVDNPSKYMNSSSYTASQNTYSGQSASYSSGGYNSVETISANQMLEEFDKNAFKAEKTYKGRTIRVQGIIGEITSENGSPMIRCYNGFPLSNGVPLRCFVSRNDPLLVDAEQGRSITIQGEVYDLDAEHKYINGITMKNCKIISIP